MPYTARYVLEHYLSEGRKGNKLYAGVAAPDGEKDAVEAARRRR